MAERNGKIFPSDSLSELFDGLEPLSPLCDEICRCIISVDEISDDASSNLKSIRRSIRSTGDRIHAQLNQMLNNQNVRNCLQDFVITMRNGRYCLPVKAEAKSQITGMCMTSPPAVLLFSLSQWLW